MPERTPKSGREYLSGTHFRCSLLKFPGFSVFETLSHFVWPQSCPVCGKIGVSCCDGCLRSAAAPLPPFCAKCGAPFGNECCSGSVLCNALSLHEGISRELLLDLKYRNVRSLGMPMGKLVGENFRKTDADMLLPVPLHRSGRREYNQSLLLAKGISLMWNIPVKDDVLYWRIEIGSQAGKKGISRDMMPANAMEASKSLEGLSVVLVDDVYTTGNTMRTAISAVQRAGGRVASALVWSRRIPSQENEAAWQDVAETSI